MLQVESQMQRAANAGRYVPSFLGRARGLLYTNPLQTKPESLLVEDVSLLDISFYQRTANFRTMLSNGISGVIIRAGQNLWEDSKAKLFMTDAELAGMPVGSYWFYDSRVSPKEQAKLWAKTNASFDTPLMCWADYEENYGGPYKGWKEFYNFLEACKTEMPERKFGIYTGYYYWVEHSPNPITQAANLAYFGQYPLWLAWYANDVSYVKIPKPWNKMLFWQRTDNGDGTKYGVGSLSVDMNSFFGTKEEFNTYFQLDDDEGDGMAEITYTGTVKSTITLGAIVRASPNGTDSGQRIPANTRVEITGQPVQAGSYNWYNVVTPVVGWVASVLLDVQPVPTTSEHVLEVFVDGVLKYREEF